MADCYINGWCRTVDALNSRGYARTFLPLDEAIAYRGAFVIVSGSDVRADVNAFGAS